jgi:hypothetical protein
MTPICIQHRQEDLNRLSFGNVFDEIRLHGHAGRSLIVEGAEKKISKKFLFNNINLGNNYQDFCKLSSVSAIFLFVISISFL